MRHTRYQGAIVRDSSILLIRHLSRNTGNRYWVVPGGGIEAGETEIACVEREMREETGLDVRVGRLLVDAREKKGRFYRRQKTYLCTPTGGTAAPGVEPEDEAANFAITDVRWFDLADPPSWFEYIAGKEWVVPLLWAIRSALGYQDTAPTGTEKLDLVPDDDDPSRVRIAREADLGAAKAILLASRHAITGAEPPLQPTEHFDESDLESILESDLRAGNLRIAELDGSPVGLASASEAYRPEHREVRWRCEGTAISVHRIAVVPEARRRGVAASLLRSIEHRARTLRYNAVRIEVCTANAAAIALCESRGYHRIGVVRHAGADCLCFERSCRKPPKE